jgi:ATP-dependent Clp protease adaptor protein ClpS
MSVIRISKKASDKTGRLVSGNDRRRRLSLFAHGVKGEPWVDIESNLASHASSETDEGRIGVPAEVNETSSGRSGRWAVVLFNDEHHSMDYVVWALLKTFPEMSTTEASLIMLEAHNTGKGVVTLCDREQAVGYRDALRILQLKCETEPGW